MNVDNNEIKTEEVSPDAADSTPTAEYEAVKAERDELKELLLRRQAEFDNFRKRTERERSEPSAECSSISPVKAFVSPDRQRRPPTRMRLVQEVATGPTAGGGGGVLDPSRHTTSVVIAPASSASARTRSARLVFARRVGSWSGRDMAGGYWTRARKKRLVSAPV